MSEVKSFSEQLLENYPTEFPVELLENHDDNFVKCNKPARLDNQLPEFELIEEHKRCDLSDILEYYESLKKDRRIRSVSLGNDIIIEDIRCSHCHTCVEWAILCECGKRMCEKCWTEKTEEQAIVNGAKQWKKREESLKQCFAHRQLYSIQKQGVSFFCDSCGTDNLPTYGDKPSLHCRIKNLDLCFDCVNLEKGKKIMELSQHPDGFQTWAEYNPLNFDSIPDFVPIMCSNEHELLYNINPDSKYYHKVMLNTSDDHGRSCYYMVDTDLYDTIKLLKDRIDNYKAQEKPSWEHHYASPISQLAQDLGFQVYLG